MATMASVWNKRRVSDRVKLCHAAGLEGKPGSADWKDIDKDTREAIIKTILRLAAAHRKRRAKISGKTAKKLGVSKEYILGCPYWVQENREPTEEEFQRWARNQHDKACKHYEPAYPLKHYRGRCFHHVKMKKPCTAFFSHSGICETGIFVPDKISITTWSDFQKQYRKAARKVKRILEL